MKADEVLKDHRDTRAQLCGIDTIDVNAIPRDGARSGPIEPCQEFRERGLTGTGSRRPVPRTNNEVAHAPSLPKEPGTAEVGNARIRVSKPTFTYLPHGLHGLQPVQTV
jgi:hypothetical protein